MSHSHLMWITITTARLSPKVMQMLRCYVMEHDMFTENQHVTKKPRWRKQVFSVHQIKQNLKDSFGNLLTYVTLPKEVYYLRTRSGTSSPPWSREPIEITTGCKENFSTTVNQCILKMVKRWKDRYWITQLAAFYTIHAQCIMYNYTVLHYWLYTFAPTLSFQASWRVKVSASFNGVQLPSQGARCLAP